jgi:hypothetical protein
VTLTEFLNIFFSLLSSCSSFRDSTYEQEAADVDEDLNGIDKIFEGIGYPPIYQSTQIMSGMTSSAPHPTNQTKAFLCLTWILVDFLDISYMNPNLYKRRTLNHVLMCLYS